MSTILVAGPPCGGKTTYVQTHAQPGDEVVDYDAIVAEGGTSQDWRRRVDAPPTPGKDRWVIWTAPMRQHRGRFRAMHDAEVVVVWAPEDVCMARAKVSRPAIWAEKYVPGWFRSFEPSRSGREAIVEGFGNP